MREIVFDTETTGLDPLKGHRVVEIGCVELVNHLSTGKHYQVYLNPERDMPAEASRVHGLTGEFLADKPVFTQIVDDFLEFIGDAPLIAHNAGFDMGFINAELTRSGFKKIDNARAIDTAALARRKFPGAPASLDALCKRFNVDLSGRSLHGALLDSQLLAEVYLALLGGRQTSLAIAPDDARASSTERGNPGAQDCPANATRERRPPRPHAPSEDELAAHDAFLAQIIDPLWKKLS
ncbi:MAG: DNA polymerase III subunit epsilon [Bdellovibrionales bacterium]